MNEIARVIGTGAIISEQWDIYKRQERARRPQKNVGLNVTTLPSE